MYELQELGDIIRALQICMKNRNLSNARHLHACVCSSGLEWCWDVGNHVVPMFTECGSLLDAQTTFNKLEHRNVHCWNYLMLGYVHAGQSPYALHLYKKMQYENVQPNCQTAVALLKAIMSLENAEQGQQAHIDIVRKGFEQDTFVNSTLIHMYVKMGFLSEARDLFERFVARDVVLWNTMIMGYTESGDNASALECYKEMQSNNMFPSMVTFACILRTLGNIGNIDDAQELYTNIVYKGYDSDLFVSGNLVDMYVKCGRLTDADNILSALPVQNTVLWNTLIAGYVDYGFPQKVFTCFERMLKEGIDQDNVTMMCLLKACVYMEDVEKGHKVHKNIVLKGLEIDTFVATSLVDMYMKCGFITEAYAVFQEIPQGSIAAWNVLIAGYEEQGEIEAAFNCFEQLQNKGLFPSALTFVTMLKACGNTKFLDKGQRLHKEIVHRGLDCNHLICNSLIDMYGKCDAVRDAQCVFDSMSNHCIVSWNTLIAAYVEHNFHERALLFFECMELEAIAQDLATFTCLLKGCTQLTKYTNGQAMHISIMKKGYENDPLLGSILVNMYAKFELLEEAEYVSDKMQYQTMLSCNSLVAAYVAQGSNDVAWERLQAMFEHGISPSSTTYIAILSGYNDSQSYLLTRGRKLNIEIVQKGYDQDTFIGGVLVDMYAKAGLLVEAEYFVANLALHQDAVAWNALIMGYTENGCYQEALNCWEQMQIKGVVPDDVTFAGLLRACSILKTIEEGVHLHMATVQCGFDEEHFIGSTIVYMYMNCKALFDAKHVFDNLVVYNIASLNALIGGLVENGLEDEALNAYDRMGLQNVSPNEVTFLSMLKAFGSKLGTINKGWELHTHIICKGFDLECYVGSSLVDMYVKCGRLKEAHDVFNKLPMRNIVAWNAIIKGYGMNHNLEMALQFFKNMCAEGVKPDSVTMTCLLSMCSRGNLMGMGHELIKTMQEKFCIEPSKDHLTSVVDLLARSGQIHEAGKYLDSIPFFPSKDMWTTLLNSCSTYQERWLGSKCFEHLA